MVNIVELISLHLRLLLIYVESIAYPVMHHVQTPFEQYWQFNGHD